MNIQNEKISQALTDETFWSLFYGDLDQVVSHVIIQSAFLWDARMKKIEKRIREIIARGGTVCIFLQAPSNWYKEVLTEAEHEELAEFHRRCLVLQSWGVHLNLKIKVHQKLAIIDGKVHYEGSLNIMSHRDTGENMRRFALSTEVDIITELHGLDLCLHCNEARSKHGTGSLTENALHKLGNAIKRHRQNLGLSQGQLAAKCGVRRPKLSLLEKFCKSHLSLFTTILDGLDLEILLVPKRHILAISSHLDRLISTQLEERHDPWSKQRIEDVYRLSPFELHVPPALAKKNVTAAAATPKQKLQSMPTSQASV